MASDVEIRCFCSRNPLLAVGGRGDDGKGFIHIKSWKGKRLYTEAYITEGTVYVRCRECLRWHRVTIVYRKVQSQPSELPTSIGNSV